MDIVQHHIVPYCEIRTVIMLVSTCKKYREMQVWNYVVKRDFNAVFELCEKTCNFCKPSAVEIYKNSSKKILFYEDSFIGEIKTGHVEILKRIYPGFDYFRVDFTRKPIAKKMINHLWKAGKLTETCSGKQDCHCFDCRMKLLCAITGEN